MTTRVERADERLADLHVLVADDEAQVIKILESILLGMGIKNITRAANGTQAMEAFANYADRIGLIICDWNMPEMTGLDVLRFVRSHNRSLPFLMLTGKATQDSVMAARDSGVSAYIRKPFSIGEIEEKVMKLINRN